jgi:hypothetical protein
VSTEEPMSIEDRVRTATRAGATLVRDIGPLAAADPVRLRRRPGPAQRRWRSWGIPLAAAAAVVLVALSLVAVRQFGTPAPFAGGSVTTAPTAVPRYYVALGHEETSHAGPTGSGALIVGDDLTGRAIATVTPPRGMNFDRVQGGSDDRTFVVMASSAKPLELPPYTWYLLRIAPGTGHPYQLTELPIKLPGNDPVAFSYALSPDGRELAVESEPATPRAGSVTTLGIYSVSSGAELRAWTTDLHGISGLGQDTLSWLSDGRQLAFSAPDLTNMYPSNQLRTLDVTGPGTDLMAASRALFTAEGPISSPSDCWGLYPTPDGGTVICTTQYNLLTIPGINADCGGGGLEVIAYSVRTGKPVRVLYRYPGACHNGVSYVLWTGASATSIIGATEINAASEGAKQTGQLGVITDGHIRLLKLPESVSPTDDGTVAF